MNRTLTATSLLCCTLTTMGQGSLNIHRVIGQTPPVTQVRMTDIDSVVNVFEPPPGQLLVYRTDGSITGPSFLYIDSLTYSPSGPEGTGMVATMAPYSVHAMLVNCRGYTGDNGDSPITARGCCYSTEPLPTLDDPFVTDPVISSAFSEPAAGLQPGTTYYLRAFVTNAQGTAYGNQISFTTPPSTPLNENISYGSVTDQDGNTYATVTIGQQVWMAENLRSSTYANGDPIPNAQEPEGWSWEAPEEGAWCHYNNDPVFDVVMGKLYNWYAATDTRNICPSGWHVPSELDWQAMELELGMPVEELNEVASRGGAGQLGLKLRSTSNQHWQGSLLGTNDTGFSGIAAGLRNLNGVFTAMTQDARWWTTTPAGGNDARTRELVSGGYLIGAYHVVYPVGLSVRCVMD